MKSLEIRSVLYADPYLLLQCSEQVLNHSHMALIEDTSLFLIPM